MTETNDRNILIVEDEPDLRDLLCFNLRREGYACRCAGDGRTAVSEALRKPPDLIVLDRMLPQMSGDEVALRLKRDQQSSRVPIIMLTAKTQETDELTGFALGADDYVIKPFSMKSLLARVGALLRRTEGGAHKGERLALGPIAADRSRHEVTVGAEKTSLTVTEFRLLWSLMRADGRVLRRAQLIDAALGEGVVVTDRTIDVHIVALRKKLDEAAAGLNASRYVQTVRGVGYTFREPA